MTKSIVLLLFLLTAPATASIAGKSPDAEVLGIRLSMSQEEAHARIKRMGNLQKKERKRQEVWALSDRHFSHLIVGFDPDDRVRYLTAIARTGGLRLRYSDVGDLKNAKQANSQGHYKFSWAVAARRGQSAYIVVAHGRDPLHLESYSIKRVDAEALE